ncbi:MAG: PAS domain S-box protein [Chloroflexi bacterium]|nr:PAS domain S-box protein [Chloroflexota bacterium]
MLTQRESLEPDTQYFLEAERVGGRISRRLKNLSSGEELAHLSIIDNKAVYDETGHVGFTTFSAGMEISEIEIHTRPSRFRIEQFRVFMDDEVGIVDPDQDMAGRTFKLRVGQSVLSGRTTYMVMFEETTERRKVEREIKNQLAFIRNLIESIPQPVFYKDTNAVYLGCNKAYCDFVGLTEEKIVGKTVLEIAPSDEAASYYDSDMKLLGNPGVIAYEIVTNTNRGETLEVIMHKATFTLPDGTLGGIIGTVEDITELKQIERALRRNEELYRELFENINSGVAIYKAVDDGNDFVFLDFNAGAEKMEGVGRSELLGRLVTEVFPAVGEFGLLEVFRRVWRTGKPEHHPISFYIDENHSGWRTNYVSRLPGGEIVAIFDDVTEIKQTIDELEQSREHFKNLFNNAAVAIMRTSPGDGLVSAANKVAAKLFGYDTVEEFISEFKAIKSYADPGRRRDFLEALEKDRGVSGFRNEVFRRDGSKIWIEISARYYPEQGYIESVLMDISERREWELKIQELNTELEERVRQRTHQLEQVNNELESFTYSVSHDLRTPLRGIAGFGQALLEDCADSLDQQAGQYVSRMIAASKRMGELIDELLLLSRVSRSEIRLGRMNLSSLITETINRLRDGNPERKAEVTVEPEIYCQGDRALMETVMDNLASNAWKFTGKRDIAQIEFGCRTIDGERVYFIRDNGAGFDKEYASKLFQPFQRLHAQDEFGGHGVGLASVQRIINRHGGRIWAEGKVDQGATFLFT